ncbi:hypothetical protein BpHYR1_042897 [Brachionus plicatilis]|uniref:Uncharacterized protein n=1 Tax=Brachionus plicatilis TaxID=10195 RepID=A0A3M7SGT2_BRAPC|nr:hypothetical protein BpHYR1_042897 [Brachionus plicatilis]
MRRLVQNNNLESFNAKLKLHVARAHPNIKPKPDSDDEDEDLVDSSDEKDKVLKGNKFALKYELRPIIFLTANFIKINT